MADDDEGGGEEKRLIELRRIGCVVRALDSHLGVVSLNPRRGFTPVSAQVWHGVTPPKPRPVVRLGYLQAL